jgi:hypothetical protein
MEEIVRDYYTEAHRAGCRGWFHISPRSIVELVKALPAMILLTLALTLLIALMVW